jgi:(p)ppGpp synthase/HD superfamily hydrolase
MESTALKIINYSFGDKEDLAGEPYIGHLERVANAFGQHNPARIVALLHDIRPGS